MYFIHIPKTAGVSIYDNLNGHLKNLDGHFGHKSVSQYDFEPGYPIVTCIRNPYTRMNSLYNYFIYAPVKLPNTFKEFVLRYEVLKGRHVVFKTQTEFVKYPDGTCPVTDFIRFEHLENDWAKLCKKHKIENTLKHLNEYGVRNKNSNGVKPTYSYDTEMTHVMERVFADDIKLWKSLS